MVKINTKKIILTFLCLIMVLLISCNKSGTTPPTQGYVVKEKESCPFECCISSDYKIKECAQDFECKSTKCVAIDSDEDGLTDIEEKQIGTEVRLADTDSDGLNDYQEVKVYRTNPRNQNSDGDRYLDGEEIRLNKNPLVKNSANIIIHKVTEKGGYRWSNIALITASIAGSSVAGCIISGCTLSVPVVVGVLNTFGLTQKEIYDYSVDFYFENIGDDYTKSLTYNINSYVDGELVSGSKIGNFGRIDEKSKSLTQTYSTHLTALQTAGQISKILKKESLIEVRIENIEYEKP